MHRRDDEVWQCNSVILKLITRFGGVENLYLAEDNVQWPIMKSRVP
jgi:hypothetical protein